MMENEERDEDYDWAQYGDYESRSTTTLDKTDYIAIFIASLQTIFLPLVILAIVLLALGIFVGVFFG
ncbi:MAG: hypothetical protein ACFE7R_07090 [Candidatus Hodarchaeota archaeon]